MKKNQLWSMLLLLMLSIANCKGQKENLDLNNKENMKEYLTKNISPYLKTYSETPNYQLQVNKQGCRVVIEGYAEDYRFVENGGESMLLPYNYLIPFSGPQQIKIKVYPKEGETYLTKYAHVNIKLGYGSDKKTKLADYQNIGSFTLPEGLETHKLPYYEGIITFDAKVPFDYSKDLNTAKDLTKIKDIRSLVENKYKEIQKLAIDNDFNGFLKENLFSTGKYNNTVYISLDEAIASFTKYGNERYSLTSPSYYDKKFLLLEDCEIQFYANGKVAALWHKTRLTGGLSKNFKYKNSEGDIIDSFDDTPIYLYMPEGSNELKIW